MEATKTPIEPQYNVTLSMTEQEASTLRQLLSILTLVAIQEQHEGFSKLCKTTATPYEMRDINDTLYYALLNLGL